MINRHNRHFAGLREDFLPIVMEYEGGLLLRMLTLRDDTETMKFAPVDPKESRANAVLLKSADPTIHAGGLVVLGEHLRDDLTGHTFICSGQASLSIDGLGSGEWVDYAAWVFFVDGNGLPQAPVNRHVETYQSKASAPRLSKMREQWSVVQVFVPFKTDAMAACCKSVCIGPLGMITNLTFGEEASTEDVVAGSARKFLPSLRLDAPESIRADRADDLTVTLTDCDGNPETSGDAEVYLEATGGYLNWQRVTTVGGVARFKLRMTDLVKGDEVRVKAGFRNYSGITEVVVKVA
ncbi:hypothetical protein C0Q88_07810 [Ralstonia pickettii]|uniref:Uncharacterized protein n=1 Tax=Ralstonia pickettii TaxID=329 RepID=A0A2N4TXY5_RALPI|nr:hypothetical protein [Ralstonia pickettii]PLC44576.1 hypothetical protein C0Q88_07810 [Ralstonia pickettii]